MEDLEGLKERLSEEQSILLQKRLEILFRHNPNHKHPVISYLYERKTREIIGKILGDVL